MRMSATEQTGAFTERVLVDWPAPSAAFSSIVYKGQRLRVQHVAQVCQTTGGAVCAQYADKSSKHSCVDGDDHREHCIRAAVYSGNINMSSGTVGYSARTFLSTEILEIGEKSVGEWSR
ncbi:hypothetical protein RRG08_061360 [Elysia crispata]|uniref:Uncharacterized protein n=1 Tax=Elysia crispata TaxID=231223 RepID=A0AAE1DXN8_9GAST|nr:hypothetical protein RRG08_061360 [Elysia crispata]